MTEAPCEGPLFIGFYMLTPIFNKYKTLLGVVLLLLLTVALYYPGLTRGFEFDDAHNIGGLADVHDWPSAISFIFDGHAGPLGRPLARLSFLLNLGSWPNLPINFLKLNLVIHVLNGLAVFFLARKLSKTLAPSIKRPEYFSLFVCAVWVLSPMLASASLMVVQRMTTLCSFFVFAGVLSYLYADDLHGRARVVAKSIIILLFTSLAVLTKENGILFPLLVFVMATTLTPKSFEGEGSVWKWVFFGLPAAAIVIYGMSYDYSVGYEFRRFSLVERLLTEPRVLLRYLFLLVAPVRSLIGPYQDDFPVSQSFFESWVTVFSMAVVVFLPIVAWALRKRTPVFSFGVLWFFCAHLVESTVFPLEIYFEHRNYLGAFGVAFVIVYYFYRLIGNARLANIMLTMYVGLSAYCLFSVTSVWGERDLSAELWHLAHPESERATQNFAQSLWRRNRVDEAFKALEQYSKYQPDNLGVRLQLAQVGCAKEDGWKYWDNLMSPATKSSLISGYPSPLVCSSVDAIVKQLSGHYCTWLTQEKLRYVVWGLLKNSKISHNEDYVYCLNSALAQTYMDERDLPGTMQYLKNAFDAKPILAQGLQLIAFPASAGLVDQALENAEYVLSKAPRNPIYKQQWIAAVSDLRQAIVAETHSN